MRHWTRSFCLAAVLVTALFAGGALAAPHAAVEPAADAVTAETAPIAAGPETAAAEAPQHEGEQPAVAETPQGETDEEAAELFLPYPVEEPPLISVNYDRIFAWLSHWLERHDVEGHEELIETWKALAQQLEEQPDEVWNELVVELGELGIGWMQEQLDLLKSFREEVRSGLAELREKTVEVIREHLNLDEPAAGTDPTQSEDATTAGA